MKMNAEKMQVSKLKTSILKSRCSVNVEKLPGKHPWSNMIWY